MKRIILALCVFIALATVDNAVGFYRCVDRDGNRILTDNPPPGARCELPGGDDAINESTPRKGQRTETGNRAIDKQIEEIDKQIDSITNNPANYSTLRPGQMPNETMNLIIRLQELKANLIMNAQKLDRK